MNAIRAIAIAATAFTVSTSVSAGRTEDQILQQDRAAKQVRAQQQGLAGPAGKQGMVGPAGRPASRAWNIGHPAERVRR